jgi:beta-galactosidase/beta-glucuronidase
VPGEWAMQGFEVPPGGFATYTREVEVPADWSGTIVKLRFDAVHAVCEVLVNGQAVGGHEGGFVPFELDVTKAIRPGRNEIRVRVQSESIADAVSCISQYAAHQVGGLIRKVTLFAVPQASVSTL